MSTGIDTTQPLAPLENAAPRLRHGWQLVLLLAVVAIVFLPTLGQGFIHWDDPDLVTENPGLLAPTSGTVARFWTHSYQGLYTPVAYMAWSIVAKIAPRLPDGALEPHAFHLFNLLLHLVACALVYAIVQRLGGSASAALIATALFGLHPIQVEPVAWVSGMNNLLAGALSLLAIWWYFRRTRASYALATIAFALALLSKPTAVAVPIIVALLDLGFRRSPVRAMTLRLVPWLILSMLLALVTKIVQPASTIAATPILQRFVVAADALAFYLGKLFVPIRLTVDYGRTPQWLVQSDQRYWTWILPTIVLLLCITIWRRQRKLLASIAVFVVALSPVLGLLPFDFQKYSTVADRYAYIAMLGPALLAAFFIRGRARITVAVILLCALATGSAIQIQTWRDEQTLFSENLRFNPQSLAANQVMAFAADKRGDVDAAIHYYRAGLQLHPSYFEARYNLANLLLRQARYREAIDQYHAALQIRPRSLPAWNNLAVACAKSGDLDSADAAFREALRIDPKSPLALGGLEKLAALLRAPTIDSTTRSTTIPTTASTRPGG